MSTKPTKEEMEIMKDMVLSNFEQYSAEEIAQCIKEGIVSLEEIEDLCSPSNS